MLQAWLASSLVRHYPATPPAASASLMLHAARGERVAFQAAFRTGEWPLRVSAVVAAADGVEVTIRRVGYVPMPHLNTDTPLEETEGAAYLPGFVPDPLFPEAEIHAGPRETNAFWITVRVPAELPPGCYPVTVTLSAVDEEVVRLTATVVAHELVLPARRDFPVTHWFYADALCDWYRTALTEERFWQVLGRYLANLTAHGQDTIYVPVFTPPLDGVKRPTQLLGVRRRGKGYAFDWSLVRRWVTLAKENGLTRFEWTHLFTQWGAQQAIRIYHGHGEDERLLWPADIGATSPTYRAFLARFLPELEGFLREEGLREASFFHLSDEPHGDAHLATYRAARALLRELAPWLRVMDALSDIRFAREGLTDQPIPSIAAAPEFAREGFAPWAYFCCGPRGHYLNRLLDTPLAKIRMSGWLFYRTGVRGFLHWGYNYWYKQQSRQLIDPFTVTDGCAWPGWPYGDPFQVYPGPDGPIDSLRWEVFAESLQDYALLQAAALSPDAPLLADLHDYAHFPHTPAWLLPRRELLLTGRCVVGHEGH